MTTEADEYTGTDLRASMALADMRIADVALLCGVTERSVKGWLAGRSPVPVLVRRVMRGVAWGLLSRVALMNL